MDVQRITPEELHRKMQSGEQVVPLDLRSQNLWEHSTYRIPGAVRMKPREVAERWQELPQDGLIVTY